MTKSYREYVRKELNRVHHENPNTYDGGTKRDELITYMLDHYNDYICRCRVRVVTRKAA